MIADIIAQGSRGRDVLVVLVKGRTLDPDIVDWFFESTELECPTIPFAMIVDLDKIHIKKQGYGQRSETFAVLDTSEVFRHHDPEFGSIRVFQEQVGVRYFRKTEAALGWLRSQPGG